MVGLSGLYKKLSPGVIPKFNWIRPRQHYGNYGQITARVNPTTNEKVPYLGKDPVSLNVVFYRKDNVPCDIDNLLKSVMEILQHSRVVYNDSQVQEVKAKVIRDAPEGKFEFEIKSLKI